MANNLAILNSSFTISITLQNWTGDNQGPLLEALVKAGFQVTQPSVTQPGRIHKGKITSLGIDNINRRIAFQITNNVNNPQQDVQDVLIVLSSVGFPSTESVERIDIQGQITIKIQDEGALASAFASEVVKKEFIDKTDKIFGRATKAIGIRLASQEPITAGISKSPFVILIEPLFTDDTDKKFSVIIIYSSSNVTNTLDFLGTLYDRLKSSIIAFRGG